MNINRAKQARAGAPRAMIWAAAEGWALQVLMGGGTEEMDC